jgi:hypothetical protein
VAVEESRLDAFIREYAPSETESAYLLAPRDFHNAKAFVKASYLGENPEKMLAPEGRIPVGILRDCVLGKDYSALETVCPDLVAACKEAQTLLAETPDGAKVVWFTGGESFNSAASVAANVLAYALTWVTLEYTSAVTDIPPTLYEQPMTVVSSGGATMITVMLCLVAVGVAVFGAVNLYRRKKAK